MAEVLLYLVIDCVSCSYFVVLSYWYIYIVLMSILYHYTLSLVLLLTIHVGHQLQHRHQTK